MTQQDLENLFSPYGRIITSRILCDNITGKFRDRQLFRYCFQFEIKKKSNHKITLTIAKIKNETVSKSWSEQVLKVLEKRANWILVDEFIVFVVCLIGIQVSNAFVTPSLFANIASLVELIGEWRGLLTVKPTRTLRLILNHFVCTFFFSRTKSQNNFKNKIDDLRC